MRLAFISDTHQMHDQLAVPPCDVLVHSGDFSNWGELEEVEAFIAWFRAQPGRHKVQVPGNHDFLCQQEPDRARALFESAGITYLVDQPATIEGLKLYGSPWTVLFGEWAFMLPLGQPLQEKWAQIPRGLDVLITHCPPSGLGDRTRRGGDAGCPDLRKRVIDTAPKVHVYGHIHEGFGAYAVQGCATKFFNVSSLPLPPTSVRPPVVIDLEPG